VTILGEVLLFCFFLLEQFFTFLAEQAVSKQGLLYLSQRSKGAGCRYFELSTVWLQFWLHFQIIGRIFVQFSGHSALSITLLCHNAKCHVLSTIMLNVIMQSVVIPNVVMLRVVAPLKSLI
jgi:hypothetical protein